jgi:transcriptional regulator with XRE-family HTH domain
MKRLITLHPDITNIMRSKGITNENLAAMIGLSAASFSLRKHGHVPFEIQKAYQILDILEIPRSDIARYFADSDGNFEEPHSIEDIVEIGERLSNILKELKGMRV